MTTKSGDRLVLAAIDRDGGGHVAYCLLGSRHEPGFRKDYAACAFQVITVSEAVDDLNRSAEEDETA